MKTIDTPPNVSNFVKSLRDIGYTFDVAVADILDNSISAKATKIQIHAIPKPNLIFCMLDNGFGLLESQLVEAMRLATKSSAEKREKRDLGRFGLGLKIASFSQCKKLTVLSKKGNKISTSQWDLDFICDKNNWTLKIPPLKTFENIPLVEDLKSLKSGTLVIWQDIDRYKQTNFVDEIDKLKKHLSLVFHRFLEGENLLNRLQISVNNSLLAPFNPFNVSHSATNEKPAEKIKIHDSTITITPYVLPHHSKVSSQEWDKYSTEDGYIKSQGFYLYRANRLLIYGTWWGLHKATDVHKLVRMKIDIPNNQDEYWGIDVKKSHAQPRSDIKKDLKRIIDEVVEVGSRPFTGRGRKINDKTTTRFWQTIPMDDNFRFGVNKDHPVYQKIKELLTPDIFYLLDLYFKGLEAYLPLEAIQSHLQQNPHAIKQESALSEHDIKALANKLKNTGASDEYIKSLLKTEIFKNNKGLLE